MTVTPAEGLTDGQTVAISGTGFPGGQGDEVVLVQCVADFLDEDDGCDATTWAYADLDDDGAFATDMQVHAVIDPPGRPPVDCRVAGRCVVTGSVGTVEPGASVQRPLVFAPDGPLRPRPSITVTPTDAVVDGQTLGVEGHGFERNRNDDVHLWQCGDPVGRTGSCRRLGSPETAIDIDAAGRFSTDVAVHARFAPAAGPGRVDCRAPAVAGEPCVLFATADGSQTPDLVGSPLAAPGVGLVFDADAPLRPEPTLTVEPSAGLHDFSTLAVEAHGFPANRDVEVQVCSAERFDRCDDGDAGSAETGVPDADGRFSLSFTAWSDFVADPDSGPDAVPVDCRAAPGCVVVAADGERGLDAVVPLAFGPPDAPLGRYRDPVFDDVDVDEGMPYRTAIDHHGNPVELALDVYRPAGDTATSRPVVMLMHGGWFAYGDRSEMAPFAREYARRGYVAVSVDYRLRPSEGDDDDLSDLYLAMRDGYEDATAAVEWLQSHAAGYGIDPDAIVASGWSAGAVNATNLAYFPGQVGPSTSLIAAALPMSGWFVDPATPGLEAYGPFARPDAGEPPAIVFHGTTDQLLPVGSPADLCPLADAAGIACEYVGYDGAGHEVGGGSSRTRDILRRGTDLVAAQVLEPHGYYDLEASAGGPHEVAEGATVTLDGSASTGDHLQFAWTPAAGLGDPASATPTLVAEDDGTRTWTLTVTNDHGIASTDETEVTTTNVAPAIEEVHLATTRRHNRSVTLEAEVSDPGRADTHQATVDWGDGTVTTAAIDQRSGEATVDASHRYARTGRHRVTLTVSDDDGGTTSSTRFARPGRWTWFGWPTT